MTILRKQSDQKKKIIDILKESNIIHSEFTGQIVLNMAQGGLTSINKTEKLNI